MGDRWDRLVDPETLTRAWHLSRANIAGDFAHDLYSVEAFAQNLAAELKELRNELVSDSYRPRQLFRVEVAKGSLAIRPGTVVSIRDRVVLTAIMLAIAESIDAVLPSSVYSYRLKKGFEKGTRSAFEWSRPHHLPFLKSRTIRFRLDPFDGWQSAWPEFTRETRDAFMKEGFRFLSVCDIAAYFENVQLPLLRDLLLEHLGDGDREVIHLLMSILEWWAPRSPSGRPYQRGLPQGNDVSAFLGNFFLLPLDQRFERFCADGSAAYYRYMDDVRVFTRRKPDARRAILVMDKTIRSLHLNLQGSKTRILSEEHLEISDHLLDERVEDLVVLDDHVSSYGKRALPAEERDRCVESLRRISRVKPRGRSALVGGWRPLEGLGLRAFQLWMDVHMRVGSAEFIPRLLREIKDNPDIRLMRKLIRTSRQFPLHKSIEGTMLAFLRSEANIYPHQEAMILHALRYLGRVSAECRRHAEMRLWDHASDRYVRMQAAYLLSRTRLTKEDFRRAEVALEEETDTFVQTAMACLLVQRPRSHAETVRGLVFHPSERLRELGRLFRTLKNDVAAARTELRYALSFEYPWVVCDHVSAVKVIAMSERREVLSEVEKTLRKHGYRRGRPEVTELLAVMRERVRRRMRALESVEGVRR